MLSDACPWLRYHRNSCLGDKRILLKEMPADVDGVLLWRQHVTGLRSYITVVPHSIRCNHLSPTRMAGNHPKSTPINKSPECRFIGHHQSNKIPIPASNIPYGYLPPYTTSPFLLPTELPLHTLRMSASHRQVVGSTYIQKHKAKTSRRCTQPKPHNNHCFPTPLPLSPS